jgi:ABC-type glycerol-3-phosphate transport system substrate-binding protein
MTMRKGIVAILVASLALAGLSACEKEGSAEKAGKAIDDAASDVSDSAKDTMEDLKKKVNE